MAKVKLVTDKYTSFGGNLPYGAPFSVNLEDGVAVIEEEIANHIKRMFPEIKIEAIEAKIEAAAEDLEWENGQEAVIDSFEAADEATDGEAVDIQETVETKEKSRRPRRAVK